MAAIDPSGRETGRRPSSGDAGEDDPALVERICSALLVCVARWGIAKTTLEDVAREAGCSRATIYRTFSGGKAAVIAATFWREAERFRTEVETAVDGIDDLEDLVVQGVRAAAGFLTGHEPLRFLLAHEPDVVLPHVAFDRLGGVLDLASAFAAPLLAGHITEPEAAARSAEWVARVVISYLLNPADQLDLASEDGARRLVRTFLLPGLTAVSSTPAIPTTSGATP